MRQFAEFAFIFSLAAVLAACNPNGADQPASIEHAETEAASILPAIRTDDLPGFFDCVRETGGLLIAAHRGGPVTGFPENALETMQHGFDRGIRMFEVDVATSRDGILFLLHDRSLGRTTTGNGAVADTDWTEISQLRLVDNEGRPTDYSPPTLEQILNWAVETGALLELDKKETTGWRSVVRAIESTGAQNNVILITYTDSDAALVQRLAPEIMLTAGARGGRDIAKLENEGVDRHYLIAWTGTREEDPAAWSRLTNENVEAAFGTLGRRGERLDDDYWADGDPSEYVDLAKNGVTLLATDEPLRVADALSEDDRALNACSG
ncbi:MAG: glycerophosphodiester phosphodiesterase family protein [Pseudomonadota bacterium]